MLDFGVLCQFKGILNVYAEVSDRVFDLAVTEQNLDCTKISGRLVDHRRLGSAQ